MKRISIFLICTLIMTSCNNISSENIDTERITEKIESISENDAAVISAENITDNEIKEMYEYAYDMVRGKEFLNDGNGNYLTQDGKDLDGYKEEFRRIFTDNYTDGYFKLENGSVYFDGQNQRHLEILALQDINSIDDLRVFDNYVGIWVGLGDRGSDLSVAESELAVTYRSDEKIVLTVTVWHTNPDHEIKIDEDYIYHLENGKLIISGIFGGADENGEYIIVENELTGTAAEVPVSSDKSKFYHTNYDNYLVKYDYNLVPDNGVWKFDNFEIWD